MWLFSSSAKCASHFLDVFLEANFGISFPVGIAAEKRYDTTQTI